MSTYGVCDWCFGSGLTNMHCQVCMNSKRAYKILKTDDHTIIDVEWVSRFFGMMHLVAKADRMHNWTDQQQHAVAMDNVKLFVHERWNSRDRTLAYRIGTSELFQEGMTWSGHLQCMRQIM
jgi:recombinational DNA repair protein RecR